MTKIKNIDNKCICWCHIKHLNPLKIHPDRITKADNKIINDLDYVDIKFKKLKQIMFMKIFIKKKKLFDFSDYPEDSKFFDPVNKKVIGKMKDEVKGKIYII